MAASRTLDFDDEVPLTEPPKYTPFPGPGEETIDSGAGTPIVRVTPHHLVVNPSDPRHASTQSYYIELYRVNQHNMPRLAGARSPPLSAHQSRPLQDSLRPPLLPPRRECSSESIRSDDASSQHCQSLAVGPASTTNRDRQGTVVSGHSDLSSSSSLNATTITPPAASGERGGGRESSATTSATTAPSRASPLYTPIYNINASSSDTTTIPTAGANSTPAAPPDLPRWQGAAALLSPPSLPPRLPPRLPFEPSPYSSSNDNNTVSHHLPYGCTLPRQTIHVVQCARCNDTGWRSMHVPCTCLAGRRAIESTVRTVCNDMSRLFLSRINGDPSAATSASGYGQGYGTQPQLFPPSSAMAPSSASTPPHPSYIYDYSNNNS
ncbi:hypothetical protein EV182_002318, partial [Spiromyces aspiralis]